MTIRRSLLKDGIALLLVAGCASSLGSGPSPVALATTAPSVSASTTAVGGDGVGQTYYIRLDGGSANQCTGLVDAPYSGGGDSQPCAWNHPFQALPPVGPARIGGGATLIVGAGSYMMGYGAPGAEICESDYPWDCYMAPIPSGPDSDHPTRILGAGWNSGCSAPPELWGTQRSDQIINLADSDNVEVACFEVTDHSGCVESHSGGLACQRDHYPFGEWADTGLYAADSSDVHLSDLDIHGLASAGVRAGRLHDWTVENVRIAGNGWVGWDGDLGDGQDANSGTLHFKRWVVEWNGCGETFPGEQPAGCWGQTAGGYGDGIGTGATGGDWIFEDSVISHNTSDGLDLLYHSLGGTITLNRVHAEGNAGNQVKVAGQATVINSVLVGNCGYFEGQPFTHHVDNCRAMGNTIEFAYTGGERSLMINNSVYGHGDGLVGAGPRGSGIGCNGGESLLAWNNVFHGDIEFLSPDSDLSFLFYQEGCGDLALQSDHNIFHQVKNATCGTHSEYLLSDASDLCTDPLLVGPPAGDAYGMRPRSESPAIDAGRSEGSPDVDFENRPRDSRPDLGAYELQHEPPATPTAQPPDPVSFLYLPLLSDAYGEAPTL